MNFGRILRFFPTLNSFLPITSSETSWVVSILFWNFWIFWTISLRRGSEAGRKPVLSSAWKNVNRSQMPIIKIYGILIDENSLLRNQYVLKYKVHLGHNGDFLENWRNMAKSEKVNGICKNEIAVWNFCILIQLLPWGIVRLQCCWWCLSPRTWRPQKACPQHWRNL